MLAFGGANEHGVDLGARDRFEIVAGVEVGAGLLGKRARACRIEIGYREKADRGVFGGKARAQGADASRSHHRDAEFFAIHAPCHQLATFRCLISAVPPCASSSMWKISVASLAIASAMSLS